MLQHFLTLVLLITCTLVGLACGSLLLTLFFGMSDWVSPKQKIVRTFCELLISLTAFVCMMVAILCYQHLMRESPETLQDFGVWYLAGFVSRLPLLYWKGFILTPPFSTEWGEVFKTFLTSFLGPVQLVFTIYGILKHKP